LLKNKHFFLEILISLTFPQNMNVKLILRMQKNGNNIIYKFIILGTFPATIKKTGSADILCLVNKKEKAAATFKNLSSSSEINKNVRRSGFQVSKFIFIHNNM
jgi:hypothetical protein